MRSEEIQNRIDKIQLIHVQLQAIVKSINDAIKTAIVNDSTLIMPKVKLILKLKDDGKYTILVHESIDSDRISRYPIAELNSLDHLPGFFNSLIEASPND